MAGSQVVTQRAHYLRRLRGDRWPQRHVYVDAEAIQASDGVFVFQLASALVDDMVIQAGLPHDAVDGWVDAYTPEDLWRWVDSWTAARGETRVWSHGLEFDLAVTRARSNLVALGWVPERFALRDHGGWWQWRKGDRRLVLCDSTSFLGNAAIATIARDLGVEQPARDQVDALERCRADVYILREALRRVFRWYGDEDMGSLQLSGASQGMAGYRRRWMPERTILCHADDDARALEREATWAGRCEAWRHGRVDGPLEEWDFEMAYPAIAAGDVPVRLRDRAPAVGDSGTYLARVLVDTDVPVVPCGSPRGVIFPVGRFETILWAPEIHLAVSNAARVDVLEQRWYQLSPALRDWSTWIRDQAVNHPSPLARRIAKQWSRTVIGSFGLRYPTWEVWSTDDPGETVQVVPMRDGDQDSALLFLGGVVYQQGDVLESENACPQIQSYIWSVARCWLWRAMRHAGLENVVYVDTDSLIVTPAGAERLRGWDVAGMPRLRVKARYQWAEIHGTRQIILPRETRISGLKRGATRTGDRTWEAEEWSSMPGAFGGVEEARTRRRTFTLRRGELRRDRLPGGATKPIVR